MTFSELWREGRKGVGVGSGGGGGDGDAAAVARPRRAAAWFGGRE